MIHFITVCIALRCVASILECMCVCLSVFFHQIFKLILVDSCVLLNRNSHFIRSHISTLHVKKNSLEYYYLFFHLRKWTVAFEPFELKIKKTRRAERCNFLSLFHFIFFGEWMDSRIKWTNPTRKLVTVYIPRTHTYKRTGASLESSVIAISHACSHKAVFYKLFAAKTVFILLKLFLYQTVFLYFIFLRKFFFVSFNFIPSTFCATVCELLECRFPLSFFSLYLTVGFLFVHLLLH